MSGVVRLSLIFLRRFLAYLCKNVSDMLKNLYSEGRGNRVGFMLRVFSNKLPFCLGCGLGRGSSENLG